jgi:hypothetical protein
MRIPLVLLLSTLPGAVMAQGFEGAVTELQFQHCDNGEGFDVNTVEGNLDAAWSFGTLGAQLGLIFAKEVDSSTDTDLRSQNGFAEHLTAEVSDPVQSWRRQ